MALNFSWYESGSVMSCTSPSLKPAVAAALSKSVEVAAKQMEGNTTHHQLWPSPPRLSPAGRYIAPPAGRSSHRPGWDTPPAQGNGNGIGHAKRSQAICRRRLNLRQRPGQGRIGVLRRFHQGFRHGQNGVADLELDGLIGL